MPATPSSPASVRVTASSWRRVDPSERASAISVRRSAVAIDIVWNTRTSAASTMMPPTMLVIIWMPMKSLLAAVAPPGDDTMPTPSTASPRSRRSSSTSASGRATSMI